LHRFRSTALASTVLIATAGGLVAAPPAFAATDSTQVGAQRNVGSVAIPIADMSPRGNGGQFTWSVQLDDGTDFGYDPCLNPGETFVASCPLGVPGYFRVHHWTAGSVSEFTPQITIPNSSSTGVGTQNHQWANKTKGARVEIRPYGSGGTYDPWTQTSGGVHLSAFGVNSSGVGPDLGTIYLPVQGNANAGRLGGSIVSSTPVQNGRVKIEAFQEHSIYDNYPLQTTSTGFEEGGFADLSSKGSAWTTGWMFTGQYHLFITDTKSTPSTADDVKIQAIEVMLGDTDRPIDLDAPCFGLDECAYDIPAPYTPVLSTGRYHPVTPSRIMDTRDGTGRVFGFPGKIVQGDGESPGEPNNVTRLFNQWNHEAKVTGVGGVPPFGVSAVVLNVTVTEPTNNSFVSVYPKPPRTWLYGDQTSFGPSTVPNASNLNFVAGQTIPNLVVARVGVGGKVRIKSNTGAAHVIFDVVGWYDTGGGGGDGFTGVTPARLMDTRAAFAVGPYTTPFGAGTDRVLTVTGGEVPADTTAVVLNVTGLGATENTFLTVYPDGVTKPGVSNLNFGFAQTTPNLVMVRVGTEGRVRLFNNSGSAHAIVDVVGYYRASGGGAFRSTSQPTRVLDSRVGVGTGVSGSAPFGPADTRTLQVGGAGGVPANATAVIMNVTVTSPTAASHLTVFPEGVAMPTASNLNFVPGQTVPNLVMVKLGPTGAVRLFNNSGAVHVIADVAGYIT